MDQQEWLARQFEDHRLHLRAVACRMPGSTSEADDALQEAWLRLSRSNASEKIDDLQAWLLTPVARVALYMLRSRKTRGEEPLVDAHLLPDPIVDAAKTGHRPRARRRGAASRLRRPRAAVSVLDAGLYAIGALTPHNGRITTMDILLDPARLDLAGFDSRLCERRDSDRPNSPSRVWSPSPEPIGRKRRKKRQVLENPKVRRRLTPGL